MGRSWGWTNECLARICLVRPALLQNQQLHQGTNRESCEPGKTWHYCSRVQRDCSEVLMSYKLGPKEERSPHRARVVQINHSKENDALFSPTGTLCRQCHLLKLHHHVHSTQLTPGNMGQKCNTTSRPSCA